MLPTWPARTIGILVTYDAADDGLHAIPISAPVRASDQTVLLSLHHTRDSLARLRAHPRVALTILTEGNTAFTARGTATVILDPMPVDPDYAAVRIDVQEVDDHRQQAFTVTSGPGRDWLDSDERAALGRRVKALKSEAADAAGSSG